jgi:hypothetical protein
MCVLNFSGDEYHVLLENLSIEGALIKTTDKSLNRLKPNDIFELTLSNNPSICPIIYDCKVVRCDSDGIAIQFIGLNGMTEQLPSVSGDV